MYQSAKIMYMRNITPLHVGCGSDLGVVDLPIQREKHTDYPKIESSGIKGCVREYFEDNAHDVDAEVCVHKLFGYDKDSKSSNKAIIDNVFTDNSQYAGAVGFSDARILLFPVKSAKGVFAWVTCPSVLNKWLDEARLCQTTNLYSTIASKTVSDDLKPNDGEAVCSGNVLFIGDKVYLEEYEFNAKTSNEVKAVASSLKDVLGINSLGSRLVVVDDNTFTDFVTMSTEVITRTKIDDETGAVKDGALFMEEYLPSETVMYSMVLFSPTFMPNNAGKDEEYYKNYDAKEVEGKFFTIMKPEGTVIQIGAGATIGKGITQIKWEA